MMDWAVWFVLAGVLVVAELFTGTFYLLMIALGIVAGGLAALFGAQLEWQLLTAAVVGIIAVVALRRTRFGRLRGREAANDPNVLMDIGQTVDVPAWQGQGQHHVARVPYRGAQWDVELLPGNAPTPGTYVIREVRGSRLIVAPR